VDTAVAAHLLAAEAAEAAEAVDAAVEPAVGGTRDPAASGTTADPTAADPTAADPTTAAVSAAAVSAVAVAERLGERVQLARWVSIPAIGFVRQ